MMIRFSDEQLRSIAGMQNLSGWKSFRAWLQASLDAKTKQALATADPKACGAASMLQDLLARLDAVPDAAANMKKG